MKRTLTLAAKAASSVLLLAAMGCDGTNPSLPIVLNQKPEVRLTSAPVSSVKSDSVYYAYRLNWVGYDPDGRVDHYLYAIDPASVGVVDTTWLTTTRNEEFLLFRARTPDRLTPGLATATELHVFAIRAVDNQGQMSEPTSRAFFSWTEAPEVTITDPSFSNVNVPIVPPSVRIQWQGRDDDGVFTQKPIKYRFRLFPSGPTPPDFPFPVNEAEFHQFMLSHPDSFRKGYAPLFAGWDSSSADTTEFQYTGLIANKNYYFVVTGFDEAGAYDPVFNVNKNMMKFYVNFATQSAPLITIFNEFFNYTYGQGGYIRNPLRYIVIEVPAGQVIKFNWFMTPTPGSQPKRYRWVMDLVDLEDETERTDETLDWYHWSQWGLTNTSAEVGPFPGGEAHLFYIAAEDNNGLVSLGIVSFTTVQASLAKPLLIVNDTRFEVDSRNASGGYLPPGGPWPTAAELDTFMYALGGYPWQSYPTGTLSRRGIFAGYDFDTLGTRGLRDPIVPLSKLGLYAHVVWMTDNTGAGNTDSPFSRFPATSLREQNRRNRPNTLASYMLQGGSVWLTGGGIARAAQQQWENGQGQNSNYSFRDGELVPGRMLFDFVHWQAEVVGGAGGIEIRRGARMVDPATQQTRIDPPGRGWAGQPNYSLLPPVLQRKGVSPDLADEPIPPYRAQSQFYVNQFFVEYLTNQSNSTPNIIREDLNGTAPGGQESTLDTLFHMVSTSNGGFWPTMTYYHGLETAKPVMMTGFPLWAVHRSQSKQLVDFVLEHLWQIPLRPDPVRRVSTTSSEAAATTTTRAPATVPALQRSALGTIPINRPRN